MDAAAAEPKPAAEGGVGERLLAEGADGGGGDRERERARRPDDDGGGGLGLRCNRGFILYAHAQSILFITIDASYL